MIVYHGSDRYFRTLKVSINLSRSEASLLNEGLGIYFSTDKNVASHYGKYLYTLELNSRAIKDFRKSTTIDMYIAKLVATVCNKFGIDLTAYINLGMLATNVYSGNISIDGLGREIILLLESNEQFYNDTPAYKQSRRNVLPSEPKSRRFQENAACGCHHPAGCMHRGLCVPDGSDTDLRYGFSVRFPDLAHPFFHGKALQ